MREYKYRELLLGQETWGPLMQSLKHVRAGCLQDCAKAFRANMDRIVAFAVAPAALVSQARREALHSEGAVLRAIKTGDISIDEALVHKTTPAIQADIEKLNSAFLRATDQHQRYFDVLGLQYVEASLAQRRPDGQPMAMHDATEAIWAFVILSSWTAFESLAGDLWVAGVDNDKGQAVANLTFASVSNKLKRPDDNLRPTTIYKSGINPKTNYGSFLRAVGSVTFSNTTGHQKLLRNSLWQRCSPTLR